MTRTLPIGLDDRQRFRTIEAALHTEFGVEIRVAWTFLTSQVEISRVDGRPITSAMFARFGQLWAALPVRV